MKRYILKKDLPTFKRGETFIFDGDLRRESDNMPAYNQSELDKFPNILKDWFEEIPEEYERRRADIGEFYWYSDSIGVLDTSAEQANDIDNARFTIGNYFKTEKEAEKARDWLKAFTILRDDTKGFKPNWKDETEKKYLVIYVHAMKKLWVGFDSTRQDGIIYFKSKDDAEASIEKHEKEWLTYFGGEGKG